MLVHLLLNIQDNGTAQLVKYACVGLEPQTIATVNLALLKPYHFWKLDLQLFDLLNSWHGLW